MAEAQEGKFIPSALRIGADPGSLGYQILSEKRDFYEVTADMDVHKYFLVADYGYSTFDLNEDTYQYHNKGSYMRFGVDINLMSNDTLHHDVAFFGVRYAMTSFKDELIYNTQSFIQPDTQWPSSQNSVPYSDRTGRWLEMNAGLKVKIVKQLYLGFTVRYKFLPKFKGNSDFRPYYIPGYGKNIDKSTYGFNYYVYYRFPFRKKIMVEKKTEKEKN